MDITFNVNRVIDQLVSANHTNGMLQYEVNKLNDEVVKLKHDLAAANAVIADQDARLNSLTSERDNLNRWWVSSAAEARKLKELYNELLRNVEDEKILTETPDDILAELPEELK